MELNGKSQVGAVARQRSYYAIVFAIISFLPAINVTFICINIVVMIFMLALLFSSSLIERDARQIIYEIVFRVSAKESNAVSVGSKRNG